MVGLGNDANGNPEVTNNSHTPVGVFVATGEIYVIWNVSRCGDGAFGGAGYLCESILLDCGPSSAITNLAPTFRLSGPLTCSKKYVWSQSPTVGLVTEGGVAGTYNGSTGSGAVTLASGSSFPSYVSAGGSGTGASNLIFWDSTNSQEYRITSYTDASHITVTPNLQNNCTGCTWLLMQAQQTNIGKFASSWPQVYTVTAPGTVDAPALPVNVKALLPVALRSVSKVVMTFGASWAWQQSNLYLMVQDASIIGGASCPGSVCYAQQATRANLANG